MKPRLLLLAALPLLAQEKEAAKPAAAVPAAERALTGSVDLGYRWVSNVSGDFNTYRSVVNLGEGPKLLGLDLRLEDPSRRLFDRATIQASSWGGDPYNSARIGVRRDRLYDFTFDYRTIAYFNFLPSFADPLRERGVVLNQRAFDVFRRTADFQLDLFPGGRIVPYLAYNRNAGRGTGITNLVLDANEYPLGTRIYDRTDNYRGGLRFQFRRFHVTLEQGGVNFADDQSVVSGGRNPGNVTVPFLGQRLVLEQGNQLYHVRSDNLYSRGLFTASPAPWVDLHGQFLYSRPHSDTRLSQANAGAFYSFSALQFYSSQLDMVAAQARQPHSSGSLTAEVRPIRRLRVVEAWMTDRLHNAASALLAEQLLVSGTPLSPTLAFTGDRLVMNYNQQEVQLIAEVTSRLTLRGGHRYVWGDAKVPAALIAGGRGEQAGELRRQVALAGASFRASQRVSANADFEVSPGDRAYFRTSLNDYQKARVRARYQALPSLQFTANFYLLRNQNPAPAIRYEFLSRDNSLAAAWTPGGGKWVSVLADYSRATVRSDILYLVPNTGERASSLYRERAHTGTGLLDLNLGRAAQVQPKLTLGGTFFVSGGTRPVRYYQPLGRASVLFGQHFQWSLEWRWYSLAQPAYLYEGFRTHHYLSGFRIIW